jgi:hypothetical protein
VLEDGEGFADVDFLVDDRGAVKLHAGVRKRFLLVAEKGRLGARSQDIPESEDGKENGAASFNEEKIPP